MSKTIVKSRRPLCNFGMLGDVGLMLGGLCFISLVATNAPDTMNKKTHIKTKL